MKRIIRHRCWGHIQRLTLTAKLTLIKNVSPPPKGLSGKNEKLKIAMELIKVILESLAGLFITYFSIGFIVPCFALCWVRKIPVFSPKTYNLPFEEVNFLSGDGKTKLSGWLVSQKILAKGVVIFCHDYRRTRSDLLPLAVFLFRNGYDCLLFDFRAHGNSKGFACNFGIKEALDIEGAIAFAEKIRQESNIPISLLGQGMGGTAALVASSRYPKLHAVIADSAYADGWRLFTEDFPLYFYSLPKGYYQKVVFFFFHLFSGLSSSSPWPANVSQHISARLLLIHGDQDELVSPGHSHFLFQHVASPIKNLWIVPDTKHLEAYRNHPKTYEQKVLAILSRHETSFEEQKPFEEGIEGAVGVIVDSGKVLIAKRMKQSHLGEMWEFPGGKLQPGETLQKCLLRELREEVNLDVIVGDLIGTVDHAYETQKIRLHFFLCHPFQGTAKPLRCSEIRWITQNELDQVQFPPANQKILPKIKDVLG